MNSNDQNDREFKNSPTSLVSNLVRMQMPISPGHGNLALDCLPQLNFSRESYKCKRMNTERLHNSLSSVFRRDSNRMIKTLDVFKKGL